MTGASAARPCRSTQTQSACAGRILFQMNGGRNDATRRRGVELDWQPAPRRPAAHAPRRPRAPNKHHRPKSFVRCRPGPRDRRACLSGQSPPAPLPTQGFSPKRPSPTGPSPTLQRRIEPGAKMATSQNGDEGGGGEEEEGKEAEEEEGEARVRDKRNPNTEKLACKTSSCSCCRTTAAATAAAMAPRRTSAGTKRAPVAISSSFSASSSSSPSASSSGVLVFPGPSWAQGS
eukprot:9503808-Pyramimonas_sp.AAC.1